MMPDSFTVQPVSWETERTRLRAIRSAVFIVEQRVPEELEWDELDEHCRHVLALAADGSGIGTGRLTPDARIGRMAVLQPWRRRGVGGAILQRLLGLARAAEMRIVVLHAQVHALPFYARYGFKASGPEFLEADIPHRIMTVELGAATNPPHPGQ